MQNKLEMKHLYLFACVLLAVEIGVNGNCTTGQKQSPIDIRKGVVVYDDDLDAIHISSLKSSIVTWGLLNNGAFLQGTLPANTMMVTKGSLPDTEYRLDHMAFYWGSSDSTGSEHMINGMAYPMEVQLIGSNTRYPNMAEAMKHQNGMIGLAFLFEVSKLDNPSIGKIVQALSSVNGTGNRNDSVGSELFLEDLLSSRAHYYRYNGSQKSDNCFEVVTWTVFKNMITISKPQLEVFRTLIGDNSTVYLNDNGRPVQSLNDRTIKANFMDPDFANSASTLQQGLFLLASLLMLSHRAMA